MLFPEDRGRAWTIQQTYNISFDSISMARDGLNGWATSNDSMLWRTTNGGNTWNSVATTLNNPEQVFAVGANHAVIVEEGSIEYTLDGTTLNTATIPSQVSGNT